MAACWCPLPSHPWWYSENIFWIKYWVYKVTILVGNWWLSDFVSQNLSKLTSKILRLSLWIPNLVLRIFGFENLFYNFQSLSCHLSQPHILTFCVPRSHLKYKIIKMIKIPTVIVSGASEPVHRFPTGSSARAAFTSRNQGPSIAINLSHNI